jgi:hypothetical protein
MSTRPLITLTLQPLPGAGATLAVRRLLRYALRSCGLKCVAIRCDPLVLEAPGERGIANSGSAHEPLDSDGP